MISFLSGLPAYLEAQVLGQNGGQTSESSVKEASPDHRCYWGMQRVVFQYAGFNTHEGQPEKKVVEKSLYILNGD